MATKLRYRCSMSDRVGTEDTYLELAPLNTARANKIDTRFKRVLLRSNLFCNMDLFVKRKKIKKKTERKREGKVVRLGGHVRA